MVQQFAKSSCSLPHYRRAFGEVGNQRAGAWELACLLRCCHQRKAKSLNTKQQDISQKGNTLKAPPMAQVPGWITAGGPP